MVDSANLNPDDFLAILQDEIEPYVERLRNHRLYSELSNLREIKVFMGYHVFCVWDFMSIIKTLQVSRDKKQSTLGCSSTILYPLSEYHLTCESVPWVPSKWPQLARFVNQIVLDEESDLDENGKVTSHFSLYLAAMQQLNLDTSQVDTFIKCIRAGVCVPEALKKSKCGPAIQEFVSDTFDIINTNKVHMIAAAFAFSRETLIPEMFIAILNEFHDEDASKLIYYLERHIEVDGEDHGPAALKMVQLLCGDDPKLWAEATQATITAMKSRDLLWTRIADALQA